MSRPCRAALLGIALILGGCLPGGGRVHAPSPLLEVSVDEAFYGVGGTTALELNRDLFRLGPRHAGVRWQGLTRFRLVYSFLPRAEGERCRAVQPRVSVRVTTTLPAWRDREAAPEPLRSDWDLYVQRLRSHEQGHQHIAIGAGRELLEEVAALQAPDCELLSRSARAVAAAYQASVSFEQRVWDDATRHGLAGGG